MTEREKQVWIAVFGAAFIDNPSSTAATWAYDAVLLLRAKEKTGMIDMVKNMAREVMGDEDSEIETRVVCGCDASWVDVVTKGKHTRGETWDGHAEVDGVGKFLVCSQCFDEFYRFYIPE